MEKIKETVKGIFTAYMERNKCRKTPERYAILEEIYSHPGHFNVDVLFGAMVKKKYRVCRATIYNTLQLLLDCNLIVRHRFGDNTAHYERAFYSDRHEHLVCRKCGKVEEFSDTRIGEIVKTAEEKYGFSGHYHSLYIYGLCRECAKTGK